MTAPAFDRVVLFDADGGRRTFSYEEFLALPLTQRVRYILARNLEFSFDGLPVDQRVALRSLRSAESTDGA